ncbi:MAG TPA: MFS transporter [Nordella sp.]|nr:MFS transporter [Nordella sp.]
MTPGISLRIVVTALVPFAFGYLLSYLLRAVNAVVAPDLIADFALSPAELGLLTSAYLLSFALFQLPLGILFDRYGPRRVQAALLTLAATGCVLFALAPGFITLFLARAVIGLGFAGGLMSGFKATSLWVPLERQALANACIMSTGALGILAATEPTEFLVRAVGWRGAFLLFAGLVLAGACLVFAAVPRRDGERVPASFAEQLGQLLDLLKLPLYWRMAPLLGLTAGVQIGIQTLWAGPWFRDVLGLDRDEVARHLLWMAVAFMAGILSSGFVVDRLGRRGISPLTVMLIYLLLYLAAQAVIVLRITDISFPAWLVLAATGQAGIVAFPWLAARVGNELAGRSNASLNFAMFVAAFLAQGVIGVIIGLFAPTVTGYAPEAYSWAFGGFLVLQLLALAWYLRPLPSKEIAYGRS